MKHILIIHGSARKGNTYRVTELARATIAKSGRVDFDEVFVHDLKLPFCLGCLSCITRGESYCPHLGITGDLHRRISSADALIITSPTYILSLNAEVKNLLDHFAYLFHRPRHFSRKALVISTTAGAGAGATCRFIKRTLQAWGFNCVHSLPIVCMGEKLSETEAQLRKIELTAEKFARDLLSDRVRHPSWFQIVLYTAFRHNARSLAPQEVPDHTHWRDTGLLKAVYPTKPGLAKYLAAAFMFRTMGFMIDMFVPKTKTE